MIGYTLIAVPMIALFLGAAYAADHYGQREAREHEEREARAAARHRHPAGKRRPRREDPWEAAMATAGPPAAPATRQMRVLPPVPAPR